jgi:hypothetical protein
VLGFGVGVVGVICPMYVSEVVPEEKRGSYGVIFQLTLTFGILVSYLVGYVVTIVNLSSKSLEWRIMLASFGTVLPLILMIVIVIWMKETSNLKSGETTPLQNKESQDLEVVSSTGGWAGLFVPRRLFTQTLTGFILAVTLQLTGVNAIMYFGIQIISNAVPGSNALLLNIAIGGWNFLATFIALVLVSKLSRRILITGATVVIAIALIIVGCCFQLITDVTNRGIGIAVGLFLFIGGFEAGPGCLFYILANEIFDSKVKAEGAALVNVLQWAFNLVVSSLFPYMFISLGQGPTFFLFGGFGVVCAIYLFFFLRLPSESRDD